MTNVEMNHQKIRLSPENITEHEPIAVKRNQSDQELVGEGRTCTDSEEAREKLRSMG